MCEITPPKLLHRVTKYRIKEIKFNQGLLKYTSALKNVVNHTLECKILDKTKKTKMSYTGR